MSFATSVNREQRINLVRYMMEHLVVATLLTVVVCTFSLSVHAEEVHSTKFDNVDVDKIINNERLLNGYVGCLLDRNPCTPDAAELKSK